MNTETLEDLGNRSKFYDMLEENSAGLSSLLAIAAGALMVISVVSNSITTRGVLAAMAILTSGASGAFAFIYGMHVGTKKTILRFLDSLKVSLIGGVDPLDAAAGKETHIWKN
jgi:hypothetical protein